MTAPCDSSGTDPRPTGSSSRFRLGTRLPRSAGRWVLPLALIAYLYLVVRSGVALVGDEFMDLPSFHQAAKAVFVEGRSPYTEAFLDRAGRQSGHVVFPYLYPPPSLLFLLPLAPLSHAGTALAVLIVNHLCVWLFLWLFVRRVLDLDLADAAFWLVSAWFFVFDPLVETIRLGQVNLLVLVLLVLFWTLLRHGATPVLLAAPLTVAILLKVYPVIFVPYLAFRRAGAAAWCLLYGIGVSLLSVFVLPASVWGDWVANVVPTGGLTRTPFGLFSPAAPHNQSLAGFASRLFRSSEFGAALLPAPQAAAPAAYLLAGAVLALSFAAVVRGRHRASGVQGRTIPARRLDLEVALLLAAMTLVAPVTWNHHLVLLFPALLIGGRSLVERPRLHTATIGAAVTALLLSIRIPVWRRFLRDGAWSLAISVKLYAVLLLWGWLAVCLWRGGARTK